MSHQEAELPAGYGMTLGSPLDRSLLLQFMATTYAELTPDQDQTHLAVTLDNHLASDTPIWWIWVTTEADEVAVEEPVGCIWVGNAVDQRQGDRHAYVLLLYVDPAHRRRGLATVLLQRAHQWAVSRGDRQIALQVFSHNQPALRLYEKLGYITQSMLMYRPLGADATATGGLGDT